MKYHNGKASADDAYVVMHMAQLKVVENVFLIQVQDFIIFSNILVYMKYYSNLNHSTCYTVNVIRSPV